MLAGSLDGTVSVYGVQSPIYGNRTWRVSSLDALAADYVDRIRTVQPNGPYSLCGWSLGAWVAALMVRHLEANGDTVEFLGIVDAAVRPPEVSLAPEEIEKTLSENFLTLSAERKTDLEFEAHTYRDKPTQLPKEDTWLFEAVRDVVLQHQKLLVSFQPPRLSSDLSIWWSTHTLSSKTERDTDWSAYTSGMERSRVPIDTTHANIIHHPDFIREFTIILTQRLFVRSTDLQGTLDTSHSFEKVSRIAH